MGAGRIEPRLPQRRSGLRLAAVADGGLEGQLTGRQRLQPGMVPGQHDVAFAERIEGAGHFRSTLFRPDGGEPFPLRPTTSVSRSTTRRGRRTAHGSCSPAGRAPNESSSSFDPVSGFTPITSNVADDVDPAWSPDGEWIAFASTRSGDFDIYRMKLDGSEPEQLTDGPAVDHDPAWSPDGRGIAFSRSEDATPRSSSSTWRAGRSPDQRWRYRGQLPDLEVGRRSGGRRL